MRTIIKSQNAGPLSLSAVIPCPQISGAASKQLSVIVDDGPCFYKLKYRRPLEPQPGLRRTIIYIILQLM